MSLDHFLKFRLTKSEYAIYCYTGFGPRFGGGADIHISDECDENTNSYISCPSSYSCDELKHKTKENTRLLCGANLGNNSFKIS